MSPTTTMGVITLAFFLALAAVATANPNNHNNHNQHNQHTKHPQQNKHQQHPQQNKHQKHPQQNKHQQHPQPGQHNQHQKPHGHATGAAAAAAVGASAVAVGAAAAGGGGHTLPHLHGVNRAGTEFACIKGDGIFTEGPVDDASIDNMLKWHINAVRIPLNEDCWLGHNVKAELGGKTYQDEIKGFVKRLKAKGMYVILDLHWTEGLYSGEGQGSCTEEPAKCQKPMPDKKYAPEFWKEVATAFKNDDHVIFDLFNEPFPDAVIKDKSAAWKCWQKGGDACKKDGNDAFPFEPAGMEDLLKAVRDAGANNLCMLGGLTWANDLDGWLDHVPKDDKNIAASMHSYNFNACSNRDCWDKGIGKIREANYPVIVGEIGEKGCGQAYIDDLMPYLDEKGISYLAWTWNKWNCPEPVLISDYEGTPIGMGIGYKAHLARLAAQKQ